MNFDKAAQQIIDALPTMTVAQRANYREELYALAVKGSKVAEAYILHHDEVGATEEAATEADRSAWRSQDD